jgi:hypothetical protein
MKTEQLPWTGYAGYLDLWKKPDGWIVELGVRILSDLEFGEPGARFRTEDLEGQRWMFMQRIDIKEEP